MPAYDKQVFLNVPFDKRYQKLLRALVFAVQECGFHARCAQEKDDGSQVRVQKLYEIIESCKYGIHDLSRTTLDSEFRLPRFNMPLELGIFLGARQYGTARQRQKACLILERERYRYQVFCSDIAGQDIREHKNEVRFALAAVRNWIQTQVPQAPRYPGASAIETRYVGFQRQLPFMCRELQLDSKELTFLDYRQLVEGWRAINPASVRHS